MKDEQPYEVIFDPQKGLQTSSGAEPCSEKSYQGLRFRTKALGGWYVPKPKGKPKPKKKGPKPGTKKPTKKSHK